MRITSSLAKLFKESVFRVEEVFTPKESHYIIPNGGSRTSWWCPGPVHTCYHVCADIIVLRTTVDRITFVPMTLVKQNSVQT